MKFETFIHKIVKNHQMIFRKDPWIHTRTRSINVSAAVLSRRNVRTHAYALCARVCARMFMKILLIYLHYLMNVSFKFHKDWSFLCRDICKIVLTFKNHQFLIYFPYSQNYVPQKSSKMDNYKIDIKMSQSKEENVTCLSK